MIAFRLSVLAPIVVWVVAALAAPASAQTATATLSADLRPVAKLSLSTTSLSFPDADPDLASLVPSLGGPISITAKSRATPGGTVVLTIVAGDDLRSGLDVIPSSAITWTATGPGFVPGTLSNTTPVMVAQWTGSGIRGGTQEFLFTNLWTYATGTYTATLTYTLSAP